MMKLKNISFLLLLATLQLFAQQDSITVQWCVDAALRNNPQLKIAGSIMSSAGISKTQSLSTLYPQLSIQSNWSRNGGTFFTGPSARTAYYENYAAGLQLQQLVYDFGKTTDKISSATELVQASKQDYTTAKQGLVTNTYQAYFLFIESGHILAASKEVFKQAEEHLTQSTAFYTNGKKPEYDVLKARTDVENARVNLLTAENNVAISRLQLENLINVQLPSNVVFSESSNIIADTLNEAMALEIGLNNRPELMALKSRVNSNTDLLSSAKSVRYPLINATGGYNWRSYYYDQKFLDSWNVGVSISIPVFQGFAIDAGIDLAESTLKQSQYQYELLQQAITLDIKQQLFTLYLAKNKISAAESLLKQSDQTLKMAATRYAQEVGSSIEVTDARVGYYNALVIYNQAQYDYRIAAVKMKKALGTL